MKRSFIARSSVAVFAAAVAAGVLYAQQKPAEMQHDHSSMSTPGSNAEETNAFTDELFSEDVPSSDKEPGVFCPTMKTGQLCSHGTSDLLKLSGGDRDQWVAAVRRYNKAVDAATVQLQQDAKNLLTPEQAAEVQRWFAKGLNPEINKLLAAPSVQKAK